MPTRITTARPAALRYSLPERRPNSHARGYSDRKHFAWRTAVLTRDAWMCRECGQVCTGKYEAHADHISPVVHGTDRCENGASRYDVSNGACLCHACHNVKTARESRQEG